METTIEIFRVILKVYRKYNYKIEALFRYPIFHKEPMKEYRFIQDDYGLKYLQTPYARFILNQGYILPKIREDILGQLGEVITHINGKPVEMTGRWDEALFNEKLRNHLHMIYDPDNILFRVSVDPDFYVKAKAHYVNELELIEANKYIKKSGFYDSLMKNEYYIYTQLVGLSVYLYNQI